MTESSSIQRQDGARRRLKRIALGIGLLAVSILLLTTRLGVWVFLDLLGAFDEQPVSLDAAAGPVSAVPWEGPITSLPMPTGIEQPSGIAFDPGTHTWVISTDQAELFVLDHSMARVLSRKLILPTLPLLRQGQIEAVAFVPGDRREEDRLALIGETGSIEMWRRVLGGGDSGWVHESSLPLGSEINELEASALAFDPSRRELFLASAESSVLFVVDLNGSVVRRLDLDSADRWPPGTLQSGREIDELQISGLTFYGGYVWAVSQSYTTLLRLDPQSGKVSPLWALPQLGEASDLAMVEGFAVFTLDHNWNDPRPSFRRMEVPTASEIP